MPTATDSKNSKSMSKRARKSPKTSGGGQAASQAEPKPTPAPAPAKPRNTVVRRARLAMADAADLLAKAHPGRRKVHAIKEDLRDLYDRLPEE